MRHVVVLLLLAAASAATLAAAANVAAASAAAAAQPVQTDCLGLGSGCRACQRIDVRAGRNLQQQDGAPDSYDEQLSGEDAEAALAAADDDGSADDSAAAAAARRRALLQDDLSFGGSSRRSGSNPAGRSRGSGRSGGGSGKRDMTCTACSRQGNYALRRLADGTKRCGCDRGFGAIMSDSSSSEAYAAFWQQGYVDVDHSCKTCPAGQVPFQPGSNLQLAWDGADWWIEVIDTSPGAGDGDGDGGRGSPGFTVPRAQAAAAAASARVRAKAAAAAVPPAPGSAAAAAARPMRPLASAQQQQQYDGAELGDLTTKVLPAHAPDWYQHGYQHHDGQHVSPPLYPGQCVTCPDGSYADGDQCIADGEPGGDGGDPPTPPPPTPDPGDPDPPPSPPPPMVPPPPTPPPNPPAPPPPEEGYCCGGVTCTVPVPIPPMEEVTVRRAGSAAAAAAPPRPRSRSVARQQWRRVRRSPNVRLPNNRVLMSAASAAAAHPHAAQGGQQSPAPGSVVPKTMCEPAPRVAAPSPPWTGTINGAMATVTVAFADTTPGTTCPYKDEATAVTYLCTGQQIAPYLLLTAAHCMETWAIAATPGCANIELKAIYMCYDYNPQSGSAVTWLGCANPVEATGVSFFDDRSEGGENNRTDLPFDQAIVFMDTARPPPFVQYNYIDNFDPAVTSNTWRSRGFSYTGEDGNADATANRCGCAVCEGSTCNLAVAGPMDGALLEDPDAYDPSLSLNPGLEACGGASGACMTVNGETCCVGTQSYERVDPGTTDTCASQCSNYWSGITQYKSLDLLWSAIQTPLPLWDGNGRRQD